MLNITNYQRSLRTESHKTVLTSDASFNFQGSPVLLTEWLEIWRFLQPLLSFDNSLEWLSELKKNLLSFTCLFYRTQLRSSACGREAQGKVWEAGPAAGPSWASLVHHLPSTSVDSPTQRLFKRCGLEVVVEASLHRHHGLKPLITGDWTSGGQPLFWSLLVPLPPLHEANC